MNDVKNYYSGSSGRADGIRQYTDTTNVNNSAVNDVRNYYSGSSGRADGIRPYKDNGAVAVVNGIVQNSVPFMANGGFLGSGSAVVGEVGPELLSIINGGALVTPLVRTEEKKTKEEHVQKLFYNEYNVNATIANDYDITRLAEELATEQRRIEEGKGL